MEKIKVKRVSILTAASDLIFSFEQWYLMGGYKGFLKYYAMSILDIEHVKDEEMSEIEFYSLQEWAG